MCSLGSWEIAGFALRGTQPAYIHLDLNFMSTLSFRTQDLLFFGIWGVSNVPWIVYAGAHLCGSGIFAIMVREACQLVGLLRSARLVVLLQSLHSPATSL